MVQYICNSAIHVAENILGSPTSNISQFKSETRSRKNEPSYLFLTFFPVFALEAFYFYITHSHFFYNWLYANFIDMVSSACAYILS
jgi:hypothetical protein